MVSSVDALGQTTHYSYDEVGNLISTTTPDGKTENIEYDGKGQVTASTDKGGHTTKYVYERCRQRDPDHRTPRAMLRP